MSSAPARARPERGAELDLVVDSLAYGGNGVARTDGFVVFVAGGMPGDRVRARITKAKRAYAEARVVEVVEAGPDRVAPVADHPGAPWQVLPYERQLEVKAEQVEDALRRIGRLDGFAVEPIVPAEMQWRYRNKLEYSFGTGPEDELVCGFHAPGRWDEIVPIDDCLLASEPANALRDRIVAWCRDEGLTVYDRRSGEGLLRNLVVREGRRTGQLQARLVTAPGELRADALAEAVVADPLPGATIAGLLWTRVEQLGETTLGGETELLWGIEHLEEELTPRPPAAASGGPAATPLRFRISPEAFFQTNTEMAERLYGIALDYAGLRGHERVFDLYCGIGTVTIALAVRAREAWGLEIVEAAVADAIANARLNEVDNARFFAGDVRLALRELVAEAGAPEVCVVDPPRAGLSPKVVRRLIEAGPQRVVYVSCNPTTLAPNAAQLVEAGYVLERVRPVDMFPQTPHIECVAVLEKMAA